MGWEEKIEQGICQGSAWCAGIIPNTFVVSKPVIVFKGVGFGIRLCEWKPKSDRLWDLGTFASLFFYPEEMIKG